MSEAAFVRRMSPDWPAPAPPLALALLLLLAWPLIFHGIGQYGVVNADEAFYHDIAWTMLETGDYFVLRTGDSGEHVYDTFANAPLQYWLRAMAIEHLGTGMLGMRAVSAITALLAVLATYLLGLRLGGRCAAFLSALVLLTTFQFLYLHSARTGELEPGVCLLLVLSAHLFLRALRDPRRGFAVHHVVLALLFGWKAPVAPIPVIAELACFAFVADARGRLRVWLRDALFVLPFALAWHVGQAIRLRELLPDVMAAVREQAGGGTRPGPLASARFYAPRLLFGAFPWSLLQPIALIALAGRALRPASTAGRPSPAELRVLLLYTLAIVGFYLSISKLGPWYVVHAAPFLALVVGLWLSGLHERSVSWPALAAIALALSGLVWLTPPLVDYDPFAESAIRIPMPMRWRALGGLPAVASCGILAGLLFALASGLERPLGERFSSLLARVLTTIFLGYALVRALLPLAHVDRLSPIAALAADLDERRRSNEPIPLPIELPPAHPWTVHYYFARDFELRRSGDGRAAPGAARSRFVLIAPRPGSRANAASPPLPR